MTVASDVLRVATFSCCAPNSACVHACELFSYIKYQIDMLLTKLEGVLKPHCLYIILISELNGFLYK